jgi:hypothetical protein
VKTRLPFVLLVLALAAPLASADTLNLYGTGWTTWATPTQGNTTRFTGPVFWDNTSKDGTNCNIGFWLLGTGGCSPSAARTPGYTGEFYTNSPGTGGDFLGTGTGVFSLNADPATLSSVMVGVGVSALSGGVGSLGTTEFGWYSLDTPGLSGTIFSGAGPGTTATFTVPSGRYAFYLTVRDFREGAVVPVANFYSDKLDSLGRSHFALFSLGGGSYGIGIEDKQGDLTGVNPDLSDYDYNDLVVMFNSTPVPEPAGILLMGLGLILAAAVLRRRLRQA